MAINTYIANPVSQTITNGVTNKAPSEDAVFDALAGKQAALGFSPENVANKQTDLTASATKYPTVDAVNVGLSGKQATLVSGTNIKTINGTTLLGSGDLVVGGGLTIGTTAITSGTVNRILFQGAGNVVAQDSQLTFDGSSFQLQFAGATSGDVNFKLRNSANSANLLEVYGNGSALFTALAGNGFRSTATSAVCFRGDATTGIGGYFSNSNGISGGSPALQVGGGIGLGTASAIGAYLHCIPASDNQEWLRVNQSNGATIAFRAYTNGNFSIGNLIGNGTHTFGIVNGTAPTDTPSGGGYIYVEGGALKYKGSSGTVTTIAVA